MAPVSQELPGPEQEWRKGGGKWSAGGECEGMEAMGAEAVA